MHHVPIYYSPSDADCDLLRTSRPLRPGSASFLRAKPMHTVLLPGYLGRDDAALSGLLRLRRSSTLAWYRCGHCNALVLENLGMRAIPNCRSDWGRVARHYLLATILLEWLAYPAGRIPRKVLPRRGQRPLLRNEIAPGRRACLPAACKSGRGPRPSRGHRFHGLRSSELRSMMHGGKPEPPPSRHTLSSRSQRTKRTTTTNTRFPKRGRKLSQAIISLERAARTYRLAASPFLLASLLAPPYSISSAAAQRTLST